MDLTLFCVLNGSEPSKHGHGLYVHDQMPPEKPGLGQSCDLFLHCINSHHFALETSHI